ncbi:papain family cysteine protease [Ancylostoma ceylanicum]|uniref:Papain family cysteine protease n=1 Tax=Ancylostoma ceylanicum TaxID=53326 RepID=A0A0D6LXJ6_9BILA|nr:papain family cysteine protease [Ancylostoma ceylanicum]
MYKIQEEFLAQPVEKHVEQLTGQAFVDYINEHQSFYRAEYSPDAEAFVKSRIMDSKFLVEPRKEEVLSDVLTGAEPPESFDARQYWPECTSIGTIRDQSACGSCWAVSAAGAISDELCVQSNGTIKVVGRSRHTVGWGLKVLSLVENTDRRPYAFYPCGQHRDQPYYGPCPSNPWPTPICRKTCQLKYDKEYEDDKYFARTSFYLPEDEKRIRQEILRNGPLVAGFYVYEDFSYYKSGIYVHKWGKKTGAHAVKVIGWGSENGTDYWLIANSWNTDWEKTITEFLGQTLATAVMASVTPATVAFPRRMCMMREGDACESSLRLLLFLIVIRTGKTKDIVVTWRTVEHSQRVAHLQSSIKIISILHNVAVVVPIGPADRSDWKVEFLDFLLELREEILLVLVDDGDSGHFVTVELDGGGLRFLSHG